MNYKQKKKNIGRPKINWDSLSYDDYDLDQLDKVKKKQINKIKTLQKKIDVEPIKRKNRCHCNRPVICFINAWVWGTDKYMDIKKSHFFLAW